MIQEKEYRIAVNPTRNRTSRLQIEAVFQDNLVFEEFNIISFINLNKTV